MSNQDPATEIDIVILWVDGADPWFLTVHDAARDRLVNAGVAVRSEKARHRDNGELFFLLRAISAFMPWYRKIFIVTNGQRPGFVDFGRDDIELVTHAQLFPRPKDAPSFNTFAIESVVNNIPGLAEHYIRFSDDFFIGKPLGKADFLGGDGLGQFYFGGNVFNAEASPYHRTLQFNAVQFWKSFGYMPLLNTLHVPQLRRRSIVKEMLDQWPRWFARTRSNKFRTETDAIGLFLYPYFVIERHLGGLYPLIVNEIARKQAIEGTTIYRQVNLGNDAQDWRGRVSRIPADQPRFFNLNDNIPEARMAAVVADVSRLLHDLYPQPSPFERPDAVLPPFATGTMAGNEGRGR